MRWPSAHDLLQRVVADRAGIKGDRGQAIGLDPQLRHFTRCNPAPVGHDPFDIAPFGVDPGAATQAAAKIDIDLMKPAGRIVKFIHQTGHPYLDRQTGFFEHLAHQIVGKGASGFHPAARRAHQIALPVLIGIDQQQPPFVIGTKEGVHHVIEDAAQFLFRLL